MTSERRSIKVDGVFDIETEKWDRFVLGGLYLRGVGFEWFDWRHEEDYVDAILATNGFLWAHNGGRFDCLWLLSHILKRGLQAKVSLAGQRIIRLSVGELDVCDSAALVPLPLKIAARLGGREKSETGLDCECGKLCGGYCAIRRDLSPAKMKRLAEYCMIDCIDDIQMLDALQEFASVYDLDLGLTIGASAWRTALRWADGDIEKADWSNDRVASSTLYNFAREGYYGGRVQVFAPTAESGHRYDINSAYPAALSRLSLPVGERVERFGRDASRALHHGQAGIFRAVVRVPRMHIPPLPFRGPTRIAYPTGTVAGTWTGLEIEYAESQGCKVEHVSQAVVWRERAPVLKQFADTIWKLRDACALRDAPGRKDPFGVWLKWYANSLTGKCAQRPEREHVICNPDESQVKYCHASHECNGLHPSADCCEHECIGKCGRTKHIDDAGRIVTKSVYQLADCAHVEWAAYLTAHARITLHKQLVDDGQGGRTALYCDTDSCFATVPRTRNIGKRLGQFKYEGWFADLVVLAPKTYAYIDGETGEYIARSKGIPDAARWFDMLREGVTIDRGVNTFKTAARSGDLFSRKHMHRAVHADGLHFGDRILGEDFLTHPPDAASVE